jgi:UDP-2-acetamido-2-deoxy-ribo-hexuluronate aminotransferase
MQFIDLKEQHKQIEADLQKRLNRVFEHGQYVLGPEVYELEERLAEQVGAHCISVSNGTEALLMALMALDIGPGDEVITTPFSFFATAEMILLLGATPVFVDINPRTYNIDASLIEAAITAKTKAILPVNLYGQCADFDAIDAIAKKYNLHTIEDSAQSFGATYKGRASGSLSTISCTSFFPSKPLGCYGEGGACFTKDEELANILRQIRVHGQDKRYHHVRLGLNGRLATLQAAVLLSKLAVFPAEIDMRQKVAARYAELLNGIVTLPYVESHNQSAYAQYTVRVQNREQLAELLAQQKIPTAVHYPVAIHKQPVMAKFDFKHADLFQSEKAANEVLSLPFHPYLKESELHEITQALRKSLPANIPLSHTWEKVE